MTRDFIGILEAAYTETASAAEWRARVLEASSTLDRGLGVVLARSEMMDGHHRYRDVAATTSEELRRDFVSLGPSLPGGIVRDFTRAAGRTGSMVVGRDMLAKAYGPIMGKHGAADCIGIRGFVDETSSVGLYVLLPRVTTLKSRTVRQHQLVGIHLAAALRARATPADDEAWVAPSGRILDALLPAQPEREAISRRVRAIEAARTRGGRTDVDEALALWKGLVAGRWTLVERFDADGSRHFVARRNDPRFVATTRLSTQEAAVAGLLALGQSQKLIAYTLGLSAPSVSLHASGALLKLGARSASDLVTLGEKLFGAVPERALSPSSRSESARFAR